MIQLASTSQGSMNLTNSLLRPKMKKNFVAQLESGSKIFILR